MMPLDSLVVLDFAAEEIVAGFASREHTILPTNRGKQDHSQGKFGKCNVAAVFAGSPRRGYKAAARPHHVR